MGVHLMYFSPQSSFRVSVIMAMIFQPHFKYELVVQASVAVTYFH